MEHGLMMGMLVGGVLLSSIPIALGVGLGIIGLRHYRAWRAEERTPPG